MAEVCTSLNEGKPIIPWKEFLTMMRRGPMTGWRWRKKGWIDVINIAGNLYVSRESIAQFVARAASGEFSKPKPGRYQKKGVV